MKHLIILFFSQYSFAIAGSGSSLDVNFINEFLSESSQFGLLPQAKCGEEIHSDSSLNFKRGKSRFLTDNEIPESIKKARNSMKPICRCIVGKYTCSTVWSVAKGGYFVTNLHVAENGTLAEEYYQKDLPEHCNGKFKWVSLNEKGETIPVNIKVVKKGKRPKNRKPDHMGIDNYERNWDLVYLKIEGLESTPPLQFAKEDIQVGDTLYHLGYGIGHMRHDKIANVSRGKVLYSGNIDEVKKVNHREMFAKDNKDKGYIGNFLGVNGTSGGPVINKKGEVVGVFWGKDATWRESFKTQKMFDELKNGSYAYPEEISYFIPAQKVKEFVKSSKFSP